MFRVFVLELRPVKNILLVTSLTVGWAVSMIAVPVSEEYVAKKSKMAPKLNDLAHPTARRCRLRMLALLLNAQQKNP